jgi:3-methyladenine DNA glycosylase AlkD
VTTSQAVAEARRRLRALPTMDAAHLRALRREISKELRARDGAEVLDWGERLAQSGDPGARYLAYEAILLHPTAPARLGPVRLCRLGHGMDRWEAVDGFAVYVAGPAWRDGRVGDAEIARWARSKDRWWRRAALVATVPLNSKSRGGRGDAARTLGVCRRLLADRDDMVVKAMSWALRELGKRDPAAVRRFLAQAGERLAARVRREVGNKLRTGLKNPKPMR